MLVGEKPGIGGELLLGQTSHKNISIYPKGLGGDKPAWVAFDRQVGQFTIREFNIPFINQCTESIRFYSKHSIL